jgi:plastocyanin
MRRFLLLMSALLTMVALPAPPAHAFHLFPTSPDGTDPINHTCGTTLHSAPTTPPDALVHVNVFFFTTDPADATADPPNVTHIPLGGTVQWKWDLWHCHSITWSTVGPLGTNGGAGFMPGPADLVRPSPGNDSWTVTFPTAGTFEYRCVHHAILGMTGTVIVG